MAVMAPPEGRDWEYELKFDGYRAIGVETDRGPRLFSRNGRDFTTRFPTIATALGALPRETVIDGEIVAVGEDGRRSFSSLRRTTTERQSCFTRSTS